MPNLVLSRKANQTVILTEGATRIVIKTVRFKGNSVLYAIDAPESVKILRGELEQRDRENGGDAA